MTYPENSEWKEFICFRDYLKNHLQELQEYAEIKKQAAFEANYNREQYRKIKELMFKKVNSLASRPPNHPKISIYIATCIDGYIARTDGGLDWLEYGHSGDEDYGFQKFISDIDALVLGRNTYEVVSGFAEWPYKGKRVIVLSNTLKNVRKEAELFCGHLTDLASILHSEGIKPVWADGEITVSRFLEAGLVDDITISVIATILGSGIPLFSTMNREHKCHLVSIQSYPSGLVQLKYKVVK